MKARRFNYFTVVLISGNENQESYSWYKCKNNRKWAQFPGGKEKKMKNTMTMNNEARQDNIIYINESDGEWVSMFRIPVRFGILDKLLMHVNSN